MSEPKGKDLISIREAAHILGFRQSTPIVNYLNNKRLTTYSKRGSKRRWLSREEVYSLPKLSSATQSTEDLG